MPHPSFSWVARSRTAPTAVDRSTRIRIGSNRRPCARRVLGALAGALCLALPAAAEPPASTSGQAGVQSLDEQVQAIKSDVLSIAAELGNLEEKLLFPSDTQLAVFVEAEKGEPIEIDSARLTLDGELVAQHVYSWKELEALAKGGVQRLHTANVPTGGHKLEVVIAGRRGGDKPFELTQTFDFRKEVGPEQIGIHLGRSATGGANVSLEAW